MKHFERSKSSLFLMELLLNLLLFCVLCGCGLMFFIKSNNMTQNTTDLHNAVRITTSIAGIYEARDGGFDTIRDVYPDCISSDQDLRIYFDEGYHPCSKENGAYEVVIQKMDSSIGKINIQFFNKKGISIYSIDAFHFTPSTLDSVKEVPAS